jgi:hypothetical protein
MEEGDRVVSVARLAEREVEEAAAAASPGPGAEPTADDMTPSTESAVDEPSSTDDEPSGDE